MAIQTRKVYGYIYDLNDLPVQDVLIRAGVYDQPLLDGASERGYVTDYIQTITSSTGYFYLMLPRGHLVSLSIPSIGYGENVQIPDDAGDINFVSLTPS